MEGVRRAPLLLCVICLFGLVSVPTIRTVMSNEKGPTTMLVAFNGTPMRLVLHRTCAALVSSTSTEPDDGTVLSFVSIQQVLVSRKRPCQVRIVRQSHLDIPSCDVLFASTADRDEFISALSSSTSSEVRPVESAPPVPRTGTVLHHHDDTFVTELDSDKALSEIKGAVHVFEAINGLIDPQTLKLRPVSAQLEADILRQLPVLAEVFLKRVHSEEDHQAFWEAVVRKFFCFTKSYLDMELSADKSSLLEASSGSTLSMASRVNRAGSVALPLSSSFKAEPDHDALAAPNGDAANVHGELFQPLRKRRRLLHGRVEGVAQDVSLARAEELERPCIALQVPEDARNPAVLKQLKAFWAAALTAQPLEATRDALQSQLASLTEGSVSQRCVSAALRYELH